MSPDSPEQPKLTLKQEAFIAAYLGDAKGVAVEAARQAGYKNPKPSAEDNMRNPAILARVSQHVAAKYADADTVLAELTDVALAEWRDFITIKTNPKTGEVVEVRMDLAAKVKSLELLAKFHQLLIERQVVDVNVREHRVGVPQSTLNEMFQPADRMDA